MKPYDGAGLYAELAGLFGRASCLVVAQSALIALVLTLGAGHCHGEGVESVLTVPWTRQDYINAYIDATRAAHPDWSAWVSSLESRTSVSRFLLAELKPVAALYRETGEADYFNAARAVLTSAAAHPPTDTQFSLSEAAYIYDQINDSPLLTPATRSSIEGLLANMANTAVLLEKGTAMNRGISNALGLAYAAKLLPNHPSRASWVATHTANWNNDLIRLKDTNEDTAHYNPLFLPMVMSYVDVAGINAQAFYSDPDIKAMFTRYGDLVTPLGVNTGYGDGRFGDHITPGTFEKLSSIYDDGRYKYLAQRAFNFVRSQPGSSNYVADEDIGVIVAFDAADDSVPALADPDVPRLVYQDRRYGREVPDKLILAQGRDGNGLKLMMNLFDGGGHGSADGSAIIGLYYNNSVLLPGSAGTDGAVFEQENNNLLLVRRPGENFPYAGHTNHSNNSWRRVTIDLAAPNTATGNLTVDLAKIASAGLRITRSDNGSDYSDYDLYLDDIRLSGDAGTLVIEDFQSAGDAAAWGGSAVSGATAGSNGVRIDNAGRFPAFRIPAPLNATPYETLEFWVKLDLDSQASIRPDVQVVINQSTPSATNRWQGFLLNTSHRGEMTVGRAFEHVQFASTDVEVKDQMGGDNLQRRDLMLLPNGLTWVRDRFTFTDSQAAQVGPIWNVHNITGSGTNWRQTRQSQGMALYADPMSLLVHFLEAPGLQVGQAPNPNIPGSNGVYQKWSGTAAAGDQVTFNTLLLANDGSTAAVSTFHSELQTLQADDGATVLALGDARFGSNPERTLLAVGGIETDAEFFYFEGTPAGSPSYAAALNLRNLSSQGQAVVRAASDLRSAELSVSPLEWRATLDATSPSHVRLYFAGEPGDVRLNGADHPFLFDPQSQELSVEVAAGESVLSATRAHHWQATAPVADWLAPTSWLEHATPQSNWKAVVENSTSSNGLTARLNGVSEVDNVVVAGTAGRMTLALGTNSVLAARYGALIEDGGEITGDGTIDGPVDVSGAIAVSVPGASLRVQGTLQLSEADLRVTNDYAQPRGVQTGLATVVSAQFVTGSFAAGVVGGRPHLGRGHWAEEVELTPTAVRANIYAALEGDADGSGSIDLADGQLLGENWLSTSTDWLEGDFDANGTTDLLDALSWVSNFGAPGGGETGTAAGFVDQGGRVFVSLEDAAWYRVYLADEHGLAVATSGVANGMVRRIDTGGAPTHSQAALEQTVGWGQFALENALDTGGIPHFTGISIDLSAASAAGATQLLLEHASLGTPEHRVSLRILEIDGLGDFNGDGWTDASDYVVWRALYGAAEQLAADRNFDGVVDTADYVIWRDQLGSPMASAGQILDLGLTVPEPSAAVIAALAVVVSGFTSLCKSPHFPAVVPDAECRAD